MTITTQEQSMGKYGFIGTGLMGNAMALNLLAAGHALTVYNRHADKCKNLVAAGARQVGTPLEVVAAADITFCMVSDPAAVLAVCFSPHGVIQGVGPGKGYVDLSTVDPQTAEKIGISIQARGGCYLEAPVVGSLQPAKDGQLLIMAAGDRALWEQVQPAFAVLAKKSLFLGETIGSAAAMKLAVNMMMGSQMAVFAEALALTAACDLHRETFLEVLAASALACPLLQGKGVAIAAENYTANFPLKHLQKDLRLALQLADSKAQPMAAVAAANEMLKRACHNGLGDEDMCALFKTV